eukprot:1890283-Prymnesium_polylepis.1
MKAAQTAYQALLGNTSCADVACLLQLDALAVAAAFGYLGSALGPVIDGVALVDEPHELLRAGRYNRGVPVILGHNREENAWGISPPGARANFSEAQCDAMLSQARLTDGETRRVKSLYASNGTFPYPPVRGNQSFWWWAAAASLSDVEWGLGHCSVRRVARILVDGGSPAVYAYEFAHPAQGDATDGT